MQTYSSFDPPKRKSVPQLVGMHTRAAGLPFIPNQDAYFAAEHSGNWLVAVLDGIDKNKKGDVAARIVVKHLQKNAERILGKRNAGEVEAELGRAFTQFNADVHEELKDVENPKGVAVVAAVLMKGGDGLKDVILAHVGDCRAQLIGLDKIVRENKRVDNLSVLTPDQSEAAARFFKLTNSESVFSDLASHLPNHELISKALSGIRAENRGGIGVGNAIGLRPVLQNPYIKSINLDDTRLRGLFGNEVYLLLTSDGVHISAQNPLKFLRDEIDYGPENLMDLAKHITRKSQERNSKPAKDYWAQKPWYERWLSPISRYTETRPDDATVLIVKLA